MKEVNYEEDGKRKKVVTPWLTTDEAAVYCGISRSTFEGHAKGVPHGGSLRHKRYHRDMLDRWINNELSVPFAPAKEEAEASGDPRGRTRRASEPLTDPITGKVFGR